MRGFLAVAETGSVTRAADRLGRTQSAISMQIRK
ncbi:MAG: LysR family transcriptional regulator, partial [Pseudorhodobacter sp.]